MSRIDIDRLKRLLQPRHVAVIGGKWSDEVVRQCRKFGYQGEIWPVNPKREELAGVRCYARLEDLPEAPDAAFVGINREASIEAIAELNRMGAGGAVGFASGFAEVGPEGAELQRRLVEAAGDMPVEGPNCYGMLNYLDGVTLWPDQHGGSRVDRGVAILSQSGNIGVNVTMQQRNMPLGYLITLGNQAQTGVTEFIEAMLDDERITAIGLLLEGLKDVAGFSRAAIRALEKGVPIVAIKSGRTAAGAAITASHTSTLAGEDRMYDALFERLGVYRVHTLPKLLETLKFLSLAGPLPGNRVVSMSCSGGEAAMVADLSDGRRLDVTDFDDNEKATVRETVKPLVNVSNPFDYHTFDWGNYEALSRTFTAVMRGRQDVTMLLLDFPKPGLCDLKDWYAAMNALGDAVRDTGKLAVLVATLQEALPEEPRDWAIERGIVPMMGLDECLSAMEGAAWIGERQREARAGRPPAPVAALAAALPDSVRTLDEWESKQALAEYGLATPEGRLVSAADAPAAAAELGFPVVAKAVSADLAHKTDVGGVVLHLDSTDAVAQAVKDMGHLSDRFLIERMAGGALAELIVGVERDPQFGPVLVVGAGGILVELLRDSRTLLLPVTREEVAAAVDSLRVASLIRGFRGRAPGDFDAAVDAVMAVARYAEANRDTLRELDVNPLLVFERGAIAVDALIRTT